MDNTLSQSEIDNLLYGGDDLPYEDDSNEFSLTDLEAILTKPGDRFAYGIFPRNTPFVSYLKDRNDKILRDIRFKNKRKSVGNAKVPHTDFELINYSYCPHCDEVLDFERLREYHSSPKRNPLFKGKPRSYQLRKDPTVRCDCDQVYVPSLVVYAGGKVENEFQHLCRIQVIDAIETVVRDECGKLVLTKQKSNFTELDGVRYLANDVDIADLKSHPGLIANFLQYMDPKHAEAFVAQKNLDELYYLYKGF